MENFDVIVIGSVGIDTNIYLHTGEIDFEVEANFTTNLDDIGQAGGFTSRGFARLGKRTAFLGYVGDDFSGRFIREVFNQDEINIQGLFIDPQGTNRSVNFMYPDGRRKNFYDGKGHMNLSPDISQCRSIIARSTLAYFSIQNWTRKLLPMAKEYGITIACDIQDVMAINDPYRRDFIEASKFLFFSTVNHPDPAPVMTHFWSINPSLIMISGMGARGCALGYANEVRYFSPVFLDAPVIDTNGAGDALAVGFLASYILDGYPLEDAVLRGQIAARHTCSIKGSSSNLINSTELTGYYNKIKGN